MEPHSYVWLLVVGALVAFADGFGIGANDVANSFSTSVGSRSLSLRQACGIAIFTEFFGAFLLGSNTAETIKGGIIKVTLFADRPELLMVSSVGSASWVIFASSRGWPVSTTHSIVGAIIGVGISAFGWGGKFQDLNLAIDWSYGGVAKIITSWFVSPVVSGIIASGIFLGTKYLVLVYQDNSFQRGLVAVPIYFAITICINVLYLVFKGAPGLHLDKLPPYAIVLIVLGATIIASSFSYFFYAQFLKRLIIGKETGLRWYHVFIIPCIRQPRYDNTADNAVEKGTNNIEKQEGTEENKIVQDVSSDDDSNNNKNIFQAGISIIGKKLLHGVNKEVADHDAHNNQEMHDAAIKYDPDTERLYSFLQVLTASFASFAHGSNDVANAVGPLSVIYLIYESGAVDVSGKTPVPIWVLALGGFAIDMGLIFYGYHVMRSLGNKITYHSPSRGFAMELGTSLTVLTASKIGLPVSTTHCITGATAAVGLCNGNAKSLNWKLLGWCFFSWVLTLPVAATISGGIFAFASNAPSLHPEIAPAAIA
ncbi:12932_t:CDS:2 [Funneliformis geosporum]|nr:12932_t:CDS:2 [Funneliformis geosporum]